MDANHRFIDLSVMGDGFVLHQKRVNLGQPVWIHLSDHPMPAELVLNRIVRNQVQGYLSEPNYQPSKTRRQTRWQMPLSSMKMIVRPTQLARIRAESLPEYSHTTAPHLPD
jgi:hypothetical protein